MPPRFRLWSYAAFVGWFCGGTVLVGLWLHPTYAWFVGWFCGTVLVGLWLHGCQ